MQRQLNFFLKKIKYWHSCFSQTSDSATTRQEGNWKTFSDVGQTHLLPFHLQTFVVRRSASLQKKVISVRMEQNSTPAVRDFPVRENQYGEFPVLCTSWRCFPGRDLFVGYAEERTTKLVY